MDTASAPSSFTPEMTQAFPPQMDTLSHHQTDTLSPPPCSFNITDLFD